MKKRYTDLTDYFERSGKTRQEKASDWAVTEATISRWISGSRRPRWEQAVAIAADTGIDVHVLMAGKVAA